MHFSYNLVYVAAHGISFDSKFHLLTFAGIKVETLLPLTDCILLLTSTKGENDAQKLIALVLQVIRASTAEEQFRLAQVPMHTLFKPSHNPILEN